jgi:voltage-dependent potassium channel beta subunit
MQYRRLGTAGVKLSEIGLGGWLTFGNSVEEENAKQIFDRAFELGINFFDTADVYMTGRCEQVFGQMLSRYKRSDFVLATKCFFPVGKGVNDRGLSRKHILESCHASLRRLKTEYIDVYQCHRHDPETPLEETVRAMDDLVRQGKILYWGISEWPADVIQKALQICATNRWEMPRSSQPCYNLLERRIESQVLPICHQAGIGQVVFSPLAQGVLTGKYQPGSAPPADSRAADDRQNVWMKHLTTDEVLQRVQRLSGIAREQGCSMAQLALAWVLRRPEVTSCIVGATKVGQLEDNAEASGINLDAATIRKMEEIVV